MELLSARIIPQSTFSAIKSSDKGIHAIGLCTIPNNRGDGKNEYSARDFKIFRNFIYE